MRDREWYPDDEIGCIADEDVVELLRGVEVEDEGEEFEGEEGGLEGLLGEVVGVEAGADHLELDGEEGGELPDVEGECEEDEELEEGVDEAAGVAGALGDSWEWAYAVSVLLHVVRLIIKSIILVPVGVSGLLLFVVLRLVDLANG